MILKMTGLEYVKALSNGEKELVKSQLLSLLDRNEIDYQQLTFDSVFEEEVCNRLIELGYNVETQYGVGGYRIDLVVKSKDGKNNILGIECDGRLYHSSKFARERDYHRQKYLESRGWKIYRIWSPNWWKNPNLEVQKIINYIERINRQFFIMNNNIEKYDFRYLYYFENDSIIYSEKKYNLMEVFKIETKSCNW